MSDTRADGADLDAIHDALVADGIYVHPSLKGSFTDDQVAAIKENAGRADHPVYVVAYPLRSNDEFNGNAADLLTRLHAAHPEPGLYLSTTEALEPTDYSSIRLESRQWDVPGERDGDGDYTVLSIVSYEKPATLGAAFERATELTLKPYDELTAINEAAREDYTGSTSARDGDAGRDDSDGVDVSGLLVAGLVVAVLAAVIAIVVRRRRPSSSAHVLPPSAMARIREAHDRTLEKRARAEVLALGEAIDAAELEPAGNTDSWQTALDSYDAARMLLRGDDDPDVLDVVGAIVLADNGDRALTAAQAGRAFTVPPRCFLNPLHDRADDNHDVEFGGRRVNAPLCAACRKALAQGRTPDILDVERRGRPVHYFETDAEPWASTGYGSLEPDLVRRLQGGR